MLNPRMNSAKRIQLTALLVLILLAAVLRIYRLDAQDIWGDEAFSISLSQQPLATVVAGAADTHPPFYPLLLFFWLRLVGASPFGARALSALIAILAVPLIFVFAKRLTLDRRRASPANLGAVPWFAALIAAVSPLLIYYGQETRMYELVAVLALASTYFAARVISAGSNVRLVLRGAYLLSTALAMYTHYSAFFVIAAQNVFALIRLRKDRPALVKWILMQLILAAAYVPWIAVQTSFLSGKASARFDEWSWRGIEMIFGKTFLSFSMGLTADFPIVQIAAVVFLSLAALGVIASARTKEPLPLLASLCFIVPVLVAFLVDPIMPFFYERYVLVALPGFIVTVALGLDFIAQRNSRAA
ncbi:MAG TPA: glycosyltransferase family 39 protein, partial [Anaerolineae bacterium]